MSTAKVMKKLRKEMRKDIQAKFADFGAYMRKTGFWTRARICLRMMFRP
jgi:hypothetical protein